MTAALCDVLDEWTPPELLDAATKTSTNGNGAVSSGGGAGAPFLTTKRLHQIMEDKLLKDGNGSQPIFKQLLPVDPEQYITLPNLLQYNGGGGAGAGGGVVGPVDGGGMTMVPSSARGRAMMMGDVDVDDRRDAPSVARRARSVRSVRSLKARSPDGYDVEEREDRRGRDGREGRGYALV